VNGVGRTSLEAADTPGKTMIRPAPWLRPRQALDHPHTRTAGFTLDLGYPGLPKSTLKWRRCDSALA
jgi:hypothetical protein